MNKSLVPWYIRLASEPGVYPGSGLDINAWASRYLDQGLYWLDWLEQYRQGQAMLAQELRVLHLPAEEQATHGE